MADNAGRKLGTYKGWVFYKPDAKMPYTKILPGTCPQWYVPVMDGEGIDPASHFYLFLPTGDNECDMELWLAHTGGKLVAKICTIVGEINSSPAISENGLAFAHIIAPKTVSQGDSYVVSCFVRPLSRNRADDKPVDQLVLYETRREQIMRVKWSDKSAIKVLARTDTEKEEWITIPVHLPSFHNH